MQKYILTVIGSFETEKLCQDLAVSLTPLVDSPHMKFQHTNGILIFHFASEVSKSEIYDYVGGILYGTTEAFILTEMHDNLTLSMPKDIKEHLLNLETATEGEVEMNIDMNRIKKNLDFMEEEDDDDFVALLLGEKDKLFKKPSLDEILDKMIDKGFENLTQYEKDILKSYGKN